MRKRLLVARPEYDDTTFYLSSYSSLVIKFAEDNNIPVTDFKHGNVNKKNVCEFIEKRNPKLLFFNGHGDEDNIKGDKDEIIINLNNQKLLLGKITYARSCFSASILGKSIDNDKSSCFIGYNLSFQFWIDSTWSGNPLKDNTASLYLIPSNELIQFIIKGNTAQESFEKSRKLMIENMRKLLFENEPGSLEKLKSLYLNYEGQVLYGNKDLCFNDE